MTVIATYQAVNLSYNDGKMVARLDKVEGQGESLLLLPVKNQGDVALGTLYSLNLELAAPDAVPAPVPALVPDAVPGATPGRTPYQVPEGIPQATPMLVPGKTPHVVQQSIPGLVQVPFPVNDPAYAQSTPVLVPARVPEMMQGAVPQIVQQTPGLAYVTPPPMQGNATPMLVPQQYAVPAQVPYVSPPPMMAQGIPMQVPERQDLSDMVRQIMMDEFRDQASAYAEAQQKAFEQGSDV